MTVDFSNLHISDTLIKTMLAKAALKLQLLGSEGNDDEDQAQHRADLRAELERLQAAMRVRSAGRVVGG